MSIPESRRVLRRLELEAYASVITAFRAQGHLTIEKKSALASLSEQLSISIDRHRAEIRRAVCDEDLSFIADCICHNESKASWLPEGRRLGRSNPRLVARHTLSSQTQSQAITALTLSASKPDSQSTINLKSEVGVEDGDKKLPAQVQSALKTVIANHPSSSLNMSRSKPPSRVVKTVASQTVSKERNTSDIGVQVDPVSEEKQTIGGINEMEESDNGKPQVGSCQAVEDDTMFVPESMDVDEQERINSLKRPASPLPLEELPLSKRHCATSAQSPVTTTFVSTPSSTPSSIPSSTSTPLSTSTPSSTSTPLSTSTPSCMPLSTSTPPCTPLPTSIPSSTPLSTSNTPLPTSIPSPKCTPLPTSIPSPKCTPLPTCTSIPSSMPLSTLNTPLPTSIPSPTSTPSSPPIPTGTPSSPPIPTGTPSSTPIPTGTPSSPPIPTGTPSSTPIPTGTPSSPPIPTGTLSSPPIPTGTPSSPPIPTGTPSSPPIPTGTPLSPPIPTGIPSSPPIPTGIPPIPIGTPSSPPTSKPSTPLSLSNTPLGTSIPSSTKSTSTLLLTSTSSSSPLPTVPAGIPSSMPASIPLSFTTSLPPAIPLPCVTSDISIPSLSTTVPLLTSASKVAVSTIAAVSGDLASFNIPQLPGSGVPQPDNMQLSESNAIMSQADGMLLNNTAPLHSGSIPDYSSHIVSVAHDVGTSLPHSDSTLLLPYSDAMPLPQDHSSLEFLSGKEAIISSSDFNVSTIPPLLINMPCTTSADQQSKVSVINETDLNSLIPQPLSADQSLSPSHSNFFTFSTASFIPQMATHLPMLPSISSDVLRSGKVDSLVLSSIQPAVIPSVPTVAELASGIRTSSAEVKIPENLTLPPTSPFFPIIPSSPSTPGIENIDESELLATVTSELGVDSIDPSLLNMSDLLSLIQTDDPCDVDELMLTGGEVPQELIILQESSGSTLDIGEIKNLDMSQEELLKDLPVELKETVQGILDNQTDF